MYQRPISRRDPGLFMFLVDRSESMGRPWAGSPGLTLAQGATHAINKILYDLCVRCLKEPDAPPRHYFDIGVLGYGRSVLQKDQEAVEPALGGQLTGRPIVSITDLATHPIALREIQLGVDLPPSTMPIWIEPIHGYLTPMCGAISAAGGHIAEWIGDHQDSFPPVVINITDGFVTDEPEDGPSVLEWSRRLRALQTRDGQALLFNVFLSPDSETPALFPNSAQGLPAPGPSLFEMSSELPIPMRDIASRQVDLKSGARGLAFNADMNVLVRFLEIGTRSADALS